VFKRLDVKGLREERGERREEGGGREQDEERLFLAGLSYEENPERVGLIYSLSYNHDIITCTTGTSLIMTRLHLKKYVFTLVVLWD